MRRWIVAMGVAGALAAGGSTAAAGDAAGRPVPGPAAGSAKGSEGAPALAARKRETRRRCHPGYRGACLDPRAADYDCRGGSGNGPRYTGRVRVVGDDPFGLDRDGDGIACEA